MNGIQKRRNREVPPFSQLLVNKLEEQNKRFLSIIEALNIRAKKKQKLSYELLLNKLNLLENQNYLRQYESSQVSYLNQLKTDINTKINYLNKKIVFPFAPFVPVFPPTNHMPIFPPTSHIYHPKNLNHFDTDTSRKMNFLNKKLTFPITDQKQR